MSKSTPYGLLHNVLSQFGYKRDPSASHVYQQDITIENVVFSVQLQLFDPYLETLPAVRLTSIPEQLPGRLPHVMKYLTLCYIDESSVYMDRYEPGKNMETALNMVLRLLHQYVEQPEILQEEFRRELSAYWESELYDCYLLEKDIKNIMCSVFKRQGINSKKDKFEIIIGGKELCRQWITKRKGEQISTGMAKIITLSQAIIIPEAPWPPNDLLDVVDWLSKGGDKVAANQLIDITAHAIAENMSLSVILKLGTIHLGIFVIITKSQVTSILKDALKRNNNRNRNKGKSRITIERKRALIKRAFHIETPSFYRVHVEDATSEHVVGRNIHEKKNLNNLRIAQIGCGTIGGISAHMLVQSGAGCGTGRFDLYDKDILKPGNLGRHALGMNYLGENKATAVSDWVKNNNVADINVNAYPVNIDAVKFTTQPREYDLIIDATGDYRFSTKLSHYMRRSAIKTPIIFGWVDALGLVSRGLFDDGKNGYACHYCITSINDTTGLQDGLFKEGAEVPEWQPEACGVGSFLPFSSQASVCAAGLIQGLSMDWVNDNPSPRFRHITIDQNRVQMRKSKNVKSKKDCPCCQISEHA